MRILTNRPQLPFWIFTIAVAIALILPKLMQDGMFMDAMLYTSVAKNLAHDVGTFWNPFFSESWNPGGLNSFHEQPPLVYYLLSWFFRLFGDSLYTERIYVMVTTAISIFLIHKIWQLVPFRNETVKRMSWLPALIWITFPVIMWSHQNMLCENTMELFVLGSVYFSIRLLYHRKRPIMSLLLAGLCIFLATLSKGVPGYFPIAVIPLFWLVYRTPKFPKAFLYAAVVSIIPVVVYMILLINPTAFDALVFYFNERLMGRINDEPVVADRFQVMKELGTHLLVSAAMIGITYGVVKLRKKVTGKVNVKAFIFFFCIGLAGSAPLMITLVQRGFYMTPAMPFFAIAVALVLAPAFELGIKRINLNGMKYKVFAGFSMVAIVGGLGFTGVKMGTIGRDKVQVQTCYELKEYVPAHTRINLSKRLLGKWSFECYLMRYAELSIERDGREERFFLTDIRSELNEEDGEIIELGTYFLLKRHSAKVD